MLPDRPGLEVLCGGAPARTRRAGRRRHGLLLRRERDHRDAGGGVPLRPQAVPQRRGRPRRAAGAREEAPRRREPRAQGSARRAERPPRDRRPFGSDGDGPRDDPPGRRRALDGPRHRRERHRQGARRARPPPPLAARLRPVRHRPLRRAAARPPRVEPLRTRAGPFTGAVADKKGLFKVADGGTIFFDEIGTVPLETQAKLLRVLQEREFLPVGAIEPQSRRRPRRRRDERRPRRGSSPKGASARTSSTASASSRSRLPPLRERKEDIPLLVEALGRAGRGENGRPVPPVTPAAMKALLDHDWPGNVRELENVLERAARPRPGRHRRRSAPRRRPPLRPAPRRAARRRASSSTRTPSRPTSGRSSRRRCTARAGVQKAPPSLLGLKPTTLNEMLKRHGMIPRDVQNARDAVEPEPAAPSRA